MARVLVTIQGGAPPNESVLLDESVVPAHLEDDHAAAQLVQRIAWAVSDAADVETTAKPRHAAARARPRRDPLKRR
jgi:hypothetical protein